MKRIVLLAVTLCLLAGIAPSPAQEADQDSFTIAWSEYPSWSVFGVAGVTKVNGELLVDGEKGKMGVLEKKWGVDIVLKEADYETCMVMYAAGKCDAACLTNMDALNPALARKSVAILPTSTSYGADACLVTPDIKDVKGLKGVKTLGCAKSVSEYAFARCITLKGEKESEYPFTNMDPAAAATAMQQGQKGFSSIMVWNPFVMETLNKRKDVRRLFDSTEIPGEIVDMVIMAQASLDKPKGKAAACAMIDAYYTISRMLADPKTQDDTLVALGEKFSHLKVDDMRTVVRQTRFYATPEQGISLLTGGVVFPWAKEVKQTGDLFTNAGFKPDSKEVTAKTFKNIMPPVVDFCVSREITPKKPTLGYGTKEEAAGVDLRFDPSYMKEVAAKKP